MFTAFVVLSNKKLTKKELEERLDKYSWHRDVPEFPSANVEDFREKFNFEMSCLQTLISSYEEDLKGNEKLQRYAREYTLPKIEVLKKNDIGAFIEFDGDGDYRVEGDTVYCTKNYKEGKFDFLDFNKGFKLVKKNGKQVLSCKVSDWSIFGYHDCLYDLLYDFDNDKWYGELLQEGEAHENWRKNYEALVESIGAAYVHIVPFHF